MIYCSKCDSYSKPGSVRCIMCDAELPNPDKYDWVAGFLIVLFCALLMSGLFFGFYNNY